MIAALARRSAYATLKQDSIEVEILNSPSGAYQYLVLVVIDTSLALSKLLIPRN